MLVEYSDNDNVVDRCRMLPPPIRRLSFPFGRRLLGLLTSMADNETETGKIKKPFLQRFFDVICSKGNKLG